MQRDRALKKDSKCSFTTSKLRFFAVSCLAIIALIEFLKKSLKVRVTTIINVWRMNCYDLQVPELNQETAILVLATGTR